MLVLRSDTNSTNVVRYLYPYSHNLDAEVCPYRYSQNRYSPPPTGSKYSYLITTSGSLQQQGPHYSESLSDSMNTSSNPTRIYQNSYLANPTANSTAPANALTPTPSNTTASPLLDYPVLPPTLPNPSSAHFRTLRPPSSSSRLPPIENSTDNRITLPRIEVLPYTRGSTSSRPPSLPLPSIRTYPESSRSYNSSLSPYDTFQPLVGAEGQDLYAAPSGSRPLYPTNSRPSHSPFTPGFLYPSQYPVVSTSATLFERGLRSPHPPLTGTFPPSFWPSSSTSYPSTSTGPQHEFAVPAPIHPAQRLYQSSPLGESSTSVHQTLPPTYYPYSNGPSHRLSPLHIPPPLRFKYTHSPPDMPPRKKTSLGGGLASTVNTTMTPQTMHSTSSATSSRIKRPISDKKGNGWTMEQTYDSVGRPKEVIVIEDTESPHGSIAPPRKRTRAQLAAETNGYVNGMTNGTGNGTKTVGSSSSVVGSAKKRKAEEPVDTSIKKGKAKVEVSVIWFLYTIRR